MAIDLKSLSRKELEKLSRDIDSALEDLKKEDLKKAKDAAAKAAAEHGFSISELFGTGPKGKSASKTQGTIKYVNPTNPAQQWTGKGRQPNWFKAAVEAGTSPESMEI